MEITGKYTNHWQINNKQFSKVNHNVDILVNIQITNLAYMGASHMANYIYGLVQKIQLMYKLFENKSLKIHKNIFKDEILVNMQITSLAYMEKSRMVNYNHGLVWKIQGNILIIGKLITNNFIK